MKLSPLQLEHSHFLGLSLISLDFKYGADEAQRGYPEVPESLVETSVELGMPAKADSETRRFILKIGVTSGKDTPEGFPYKFAAQIEGIFSINHEGDLEERKRMVVINGGSMLYGIVREQILTMSLRHKNGPLLLPSLDFRCLSPVSAQLEREKPKSAPRSAKPKRTNKS